MLAGAVVPKPKLGVAVVVEVAGVPKLNPVPPAAGADVDVAPKLNPVAGFVAAAVLPKLKPEVPPPAPDVVLKLNPVEAAVVVVVVAAGVVPKLKPLAPGVLLPPKLKAISV